MGTEAPLLTYFGEPKQTESVIKALKNVSRSFEIGTVGAGLGATTSNLKGGLGSTSILLDDGYIVSAIVAVSSVGSTVMGESKHFWGCTNFPNCWGIKSLNKKELQIIGK